MEEVTVLLASSPRLIDAAVAGRAIAPVLAVPLPDATRRARYSAGIVVESVPAERAAAIVAALGAAGIGARAVEDASLRPVAPPIKASRVVPGEAGIEVAIGHDLRRRLVPWAEVRAIQVFALEEPAPVEAPAAGAGKKGLFGPKTPDATLKLGSEAALAGVLENRLAPEVAALLEDLERRRVRDRRVYRLGLDILAGPPSGKEALAHFRCPREGFHFEGWSGVLEGGADDAPAHSLESFIAFGRGLTALARDAHVPDATRTFLDLALLEPVIFTHPEELHRHVRWLAQVQS
jgi:hypothetical protein